MDAYSLTAVGVIDKRRPLFLTKPEVTKMLFSTFKPLTVFVRDYMRFRFMRWEHVRQHYRSHPNQLCLFN
jgi:hypothetical protein